MPRTAHPLRRLRRRLPLAPSLSAKLVLILTAVGLVGSLAIAVLLAAVIMPSFERLEKESIAAHVERTNAVLDEFARRVETIVWDYGDRNASYANMPRSGRGVARESFSSLAMANLDVDGMAYVADGGRVVAIRWIDLASGRDDAPMRRRLAAAIPHLSLDRLLTKDASKGFYLRLGPALAAVGIAKVRRRDGTGAPHGYVLVARMLHASQLATALQAPARIDFDRRLAAPTVVPHVGALDIAVPIAGADGAQVATATFSVRRDLSLLGRRTLMFAVGGAILLLTIVLLVLRRMITRLVIRPLRRVERHMGVVQSSGTLVPLADATRHDEIGSLVISLNAMLRQLKDLREQLEMQSFKLGRNESAVAVMHNVRNALNPISTLLSQDLVGASPADAATVDRATGELARGDIPASRRQKLAAFVAAAAQADRAQRDEHRRQMEMGRAALRNVLEIIGKQQEQAHAKPPLALCDLSDVVAQNAAIARYSGSASIAFSFPSKPQWGLANRVILSQVIGNLLANAAEAIVAGGGEGGTIAVTISERADRIELCIRDNGEGFDREIEPKFFQRGFSTRTHKSGGLGLHWCANSMKAMGGTLRLESDGRGTGARAILTLQRAPADSRPGDAQAAA